MKNLTEIILIGGTAGAGKTTLAKSICSKLNIVHRIGTGFIRETMRSFLDKTKHPELFNYTFRSSEPILNFEKQAELVCNAVNKLIKRAHDEGTSLIIEGNHLLPKYIDLNHVTKYYIIQNSSNVLKERLFGLNKTHTKRQITEDDFKNILSIQDFILNMAKEYNIFIINDEEVLNDENN